MTDLFAIIQKNRGWSNDFLNHLDDNDHPEIKDMSVLVARLHGHHVQGEQIVIIPDFDTDGITSGVIGFAALAEMGFNVGLYQPDYHRGHGVTPADIDAVLTDYPHAAAVLTCDVGITAHEGVNYAKSKGLAVYITDHHMETEGRVAADVVVDPSRVDDTYPTKGICGAHVMYQLVETYARTHAPHNLGAIQMLKVLAGLGTVADVMPMIKENRQLVRDALSLTRLLFPELTYHGPDPQKATLVTITRTQNHHPVFLSVIEGTAVLLAEFARLGKLRDVKDVNEGFYGFYLAPALNSIRRIDGDIADAFGIFLSPDRANCARRVIDGNERRKQMVLEYREAIDNTVQPFAPYIYLVDAPTGMLGLLANNLMADSGLPTVVLRAPEAELENITGTPGGSARSPMWFPLNTVVNDAGYRAAGHEHACGVSVPTISEVEGLYELFANAVPATQKQLQASGEMDRLTSADLVLGWGPDAEGDPDDNESIRFLIHRLAALQPFGHGFEEPVIELEVDLRYAVVSTMGRENQHLRITTLNGTKCLWWNKGHLAEKIINDATLKQSPVIRFQGKFSLNTFRGKTNTDFIINDQRS